MQAATRCLGAGLRLLIALAVLFFIFTFEVGVSTWWTSLSPWATSKKGFFQIRYNAAQSRQPPQTPNPDTGAAPQAPYLMASATAFKLVMFLATTLIAAIATLCLRSLPETRKPSRMAVRAKQVLFWQLPPKRFWLYWSGGLSVLDATVFLAVLAAGIVWVQQLTSPRWNAIDTAVANGTFSKRYHDQTVVHAKLDILSTRFGFSILAGVLALFYVAPRNSFLQVLFKADFSHLIKFHRWFGHLTMIFTTAHGLLFYILWGREGEWRENFSDWSSDGIPFLAGSISWFFGLLLWCTSFDFIRRNYFEIFYKSHIVGWLGFYVFGFIHYDGLFYYSLPGILLYFLDLTFRLAQWINVSIVTGSLTAEDILTLQLSFSQDTRLQPNSFVFISVPAASRAQWHPFTLAYVRNSTHPSQPTQATLHIKPYGQWGQAVARQIATRGTVVAKVDGPYGGTSPLIEGICEVAVIFAGGIGVTPILGLLDSLCSQHAHVQPSYSDTPVAPPAKVIFVWACRAPAEFAMLNEALLEQSRVPNGWLDLRLFCTNNSRHDAADSKQASGSAKDAVLALPEGDSMPASSQSRQVQALLEQARWSTKSPFFLKPSLLQSYGIGYPLWALAHLLCFIGGFFAVMTTEAYYEIGDLILEDGFPYWLANVIRLIALFVGAMGFPALLVFPVVLYRRRKSSQAMACQTPSTASSQASFEHGLYDSKVQMEAGHRLNYAEGRPDIRAILEDAQGTNSKAHMIHVHAAGPAPMVRDVKYCCTLLNMAQDKGPYLECVVDSFAL